MTRCVGWAWALLLVLLANPAAAEEIAWGGDVRKALNEAAASGRPVLVNVWAVWCVPCKEMDETTYRDPLVIEDMEAFVPVKIDHDVHEIFVERYQVEALPVVLFLDGKGREITRLLGLVTTPSLLEAMAAVRGGYATYRESMGRLEDPAAGESAADYLVEVGNPSGAVDLLRRALKNLDDASPSRREALELKLAEAQLAGENPRGAMATLERLSKRTEDRAVRGEALKRLVRMQRAGGRDKDAQRNLQALRKDYPEIAAELLAETEKFDSGSP